MPRHSKGYRTRGRKLLRKHPRARGRPGLSRLMIEYKIGDKVCIDIDPTYIITAPHRRYQGLTGTIVGKRGRAYIIEVFLGNKKKTIITTADHIKPFTGSAISKTSSSSQIA
ncbi:MAG: 50S ribosomal protein L21e [Thermoprotei archaeon]|nr:MAG: 50S ribosomal protein L21e [Thermoprotei archaeon]